jgi:hypothetical protein
MKFRRDIPMHIVLRVVLLLNLCAFVTDIHSRALAGEIQATEVMMESQGLQAIFLGQYFGPDKTSPLSFASQVDPQGLSFQYSLTSGSAYQGMSASWTTMGDFNSTSGLWEWNTTASVGAINLSSTGSAGPFVGGDPPYFDNLFPIIDPLSPTTVVSDVTYTQTAIRTVSEGTITVSDGFGNVISSGKHTDQLILQGPDAGNWMWDTGLITATLGKGDFMVAAEGFEPQPNGGAGIFTISINAVPEPSALIMASIAGLVGLGVVRCREKRSAV